MRATAALLLALAAPIGTQVPVGHFVGAVDPAVARPGIPMIAVEPWTGAIVPIDDPAGWFPAGVTAALPAGNAGTLIVGAALPNGAGQLAAASLSGTGITGARFLTGDLGEPIIGLAPLPGGRPACLTPTRLLAVPLLGGTPVVLSSASPAATFVAVTRFVDEVVALERSASRTQLHFVDPVTGAVAVRAVALARPTAMAFEPALGGFVVADQSGGLFLIEPLRLIVSSLGTVNGQVTDIARNTDQNDLVIATRNGLWRLTGSGAARITTTPTLLSLAYVPYASTFRTYGRACGTATAVPAIGASGTPHPGSVDFVVRLRGASPSVAAFLLIGLAPAAVPLDGIGMPSCTLLVDSMDAWPTRTTALGAASIRLLIPPDPGLVGLPIHVQWAVQSPGANRLGLLLSDAGRAVP